MLTPLERYHSDPVFRHLVESLYAAISSAQFTPTEIREAAMVAQMRYEDCHPRPIVIYPRRDADGLLIGSRVCGKNEEREG